MIGDENKGAALGHVDLHADQAISVAREVMQRNALAELERAFVKGFPVAVCEPRLS